MNSYLNEMPRISRPDYVPSDEDARHVYNPIGNIIIGGGNCSQFGDQKALWRVVDLPRSSGERRKWVHHFEGISSIIVTVDMRCYAQSLDEDPAANLMKEHILWWDSVVNSKWFEKTEFALCFIKYAEFAKIVRTKPLDEFTFGESCRLDDPSDPEQTKAFIIDSFLALNRNADSNKVKIHLIPDLPGPEDWAAIKEFFIQSQHERMASNNNVAKKKS